MLFVRRKAEIEILSRATFHKISGDGDASELGNPAPLSSAGTENTLVKYVKEKLRLAAKGQ